MATKIGINGFGRIGRCVFRLALEQPEKYELCAVNVRNADTEYMAYMVKYDSVQGRFDGKIEPVEGGLLIDGEHFIRVFSESEAGKIDWRSSGAEYIVEATGAFNTKEKAKDHLIGGARKVVITAPAKDGTPTFVMGVNNDTYTSDMDVVSNASCTTNCLAPLAKVVNDNFGIQYALMSTIHAATAKQKVVDARSAKDWRTGRSAFSNIIPSTTGAAKAVGLVIPSLMGKMTGMSFRVPSADASIVDLTCCLDKSTSYEEICAAVKHASETTMAGVISYNQDPIVSCDVIGDTHTCVFDSTAGIMMDGHFVKLLAWYDNEWGYSSKVLELAAHMHSVDK